MRKYAIALPLGFALGLCLGWAICHGIARQAFKRKSNYIVRHPTPHR